MEQLCRLLSQWPGFRVADNTLVLRLANERQTHTAHVRHVHRCLVAEAGGLEDNVFLRWQRQVFPRAFVRQEIGLQQDLQVTQVALVGLDIRPTSQETRLLTSGLPYITIDGQIRKSVLCVCVCVCVRQRVRQTTDDRRQSAYLHEVRSVIRQDQCIDHGVEFVCTK
jgi:hypothetical protein